MDSPLRRVADRGNQQDFYSAVRIACGPHSGSRHPVRSEDGADLITKKSEILQRWAEHYRTLLNCQRDVDMEVLQDFPRLETVHELDQPPTEREVGEALDSLKPGKSPGPDGIPGRGFKAWWRHSHQMHV